MFWAMAMASPATFDDVSNGPTPLDTFVDSWDPDLSLGYGHGHGFTSDIR